VARYGGKPSNWVKKSSRSFDIAGQRFEYHWSEHPDRCSGYPETRDISISVGGVTIAERESLLMRPSYSMTALLRIAAQDMP
jgi:hypothetical protein